MRNFNTEIILLLTVLLTVSVFGAGSSIALKDPRDRVVIMDTGVASNAASLPYLCTDGHIDFTGTGIEDNNGHGTNIAGLVARGLDTTKQCITVIKYWNTDANPYNNRNIDDVLNEAWAYLLLLNPKWVNMSFVGEVYVTAEYKTIRTLLARGTKVIVAAGNESLNFDVQCNRYPACYSFKSPNWFVVGAYDISLSNINGPVNVVLPGLAQRGHFGPMMSGSSQATGNATAKIIKGLMQ